MFYFKSILLVLVFPVISFSQSVSVSLPSFSFWGQAEMIGHVSAEYKDIGVHYFANLSPTPDYINDRNTSAFGVSYLPINIKNTLKIGGIITNKPFPSEQSVKTNFYLDFGFNISNIRISYTHLSNGFSIRHPVNKGFDTISLKVFLR